MIGATDTHSKITAWHLQRDAYLYVRQSTVQQVFENRESTQRQYALRERAVALGWPVERIHVIDSDLGQSAASAADRQGFQKLVAEVSMGRAGIVLGLEVSRLARNCADWHRLLELCALSETLICDEDGLYNPNDFNDRLLLGLKGTMSEAELHLLRARLRGGILNKARRGELATPLPVGFVYDEQGRVRLDPDAQVRRSVEMFFDTFRRVGSAWGTVREFHKQGLVFPMRLHAGPRKGDLLWGPLRFSRALRLLHNPRYAGAFFFGHTRTRLQADGRSLTRNLPRDEWYALIPNMHEGYISWEEYEDNQRRLRECAQAHGVDRRKSPPREGPALLQGLVICGVCGQRMTVRYHVRWGQRCPEYICAREWIEHAQPLCQQIPGAAVDQAVGELLLKTLTPMTLEVAIQVQQELAGRIEEADRLRAKQVQRARYEADLAQQRYMRVDPNNRLVADALEAEWNDKLRALHQAQQKYEHQRQQDRLLVDQNERARIMALATDFPRLWKAPNTSDRDRKRMARLLVEDVTLIKKDQITAHVRFKGGTHTTLTLPRPQFSWETWQTPRQVVDEIDRLLDGHTPGEIARILNERGLRSGKGVAYHKAIVTRLCKHYGLRSRYDRLRDAGMLTVQEMADRLGVHRCTIRVWHQNGLLQAHAYNHKNECLYEPPGPDAPVKAQGQKLSDRRRFPQVISDHSKEVQYEA
jgi:DNA invertase Pin-like site-specific DNA recombinase